MLEVREAGMSGAKFAGQWSRIGCRTMGVKYLMKPAPEFPPPLPACGLGAHKQHQQGQRRRELASLSAFRALANDLRSWSKQILANDGSIILMKVSEALGVQ